MIAAIILGYGHANAQHSAESSSDRVSLNIVLHPIQTIVVNPSQRSINLEYATEEDYKDGVFNELDDHLTIYSTGGFNVNVESANEHLIGINKRIAASEVRITASKGSTNALTDVTYGTDLPLSATAAGLLRSGTGGTAQTFNVRYESSGDDMYINHFDVNDEPTVFSTSVTYSITSQ